MVSKFLKKQGFHIGASRDTVEVCAMDTYIKTIGGSPVNSDAVVVMVKDASPGWMVTAAELNKTLKTRYDHVVPFPVTCSVADKRTGQRRDMKFPALLVR